VGPSLSFFFCLVGKRIWRKVRRGRSENLRKNGEKTISVGKRKSRGTRDEGKRKKGTARKEKNKDYGEEETE